jgi:predicted dehydrogenase
MSPPETSPHPVPRFALVGSSGFAASMVGPALARSPAVELAGILGSTPERGAALAERLQTPRAYASLEALLADDDVDAVWVATHDALHEPVGVACLNAGKHVLVEKPIATSVAEARSLIAAAERNERILRVGCHQRYRPAHRELHELVAGGSLGRVGVAKLHFGWEFSAERLEGSWRSSLAASGGSWAVKEFGAHLLDLLLWWTGARAEVAGAVLATQRWDVETDDSAALLLRLDGQGIGIVDVSAAIAGRTSSVELFGTHGWARAQGLWRGNGFIERDDGTRREFREDDVLAPYLAQLEDFVRATAGGRSTGADGPAGLAVLELVEAAIATRGLTAPSGSVAARA